MGAQLSARKKYLPVLPQHHTDYSDDNFADTEMIMVNFGSDFKEMPSPHAYVADVQPSQEERQLLSDLRQHISRAFENNDFSVAFVKLPFISIIHLDDMVEQLHSKLAPQYHAICIVLDPDELITMDAKPLMHVRQKTLQWIHKNIGLVFWVVNPIISAYFGDVCAAGYLHMHRFVPLASAVSYPIITLDRSLTEQTANQHAFTGISSTGRATLFLSKGNSSVYVVPEEVKILDLELLAAFEKKSSTVLLKLTL